MKRKLRIWGLFLLPCFGLFLAYGLYLLPILEASRSRRESRQILSAIATPDQLREAADKAAVFYTFPDGSWLIIRYRDSHSGSIWSATVARDSGGNWYESSEHFCGAFSVYKALKRFSLEDGAPISSGDPRVVWMEQISASPDLASARKRLTAHYFKQVP